MTAHHDRRAPQMQREAQDVPLEAIGLDPALYAAVSRFLFDFLACIDPADRILENYARNARAGAVQ